MSAPRLLAPTTISGGVPTAGAGTLNTIALWTPDGNTLGNSLLTQSGSIVTNASGAIRAAGTTQTSPAFTRHDTTTSGIYFPATNEIGFTISNQHAMFISSGRNVGIGTVSPSTRLHVSDNSSIPVIVQSSGSTDSYLRFINTSNNLGYIGYVGTNLYLAPNNGAGNVGIGTASPLARLHSFISGAAPLVAAGGDPISGSIIEGPNTALTSGAGSLQPFAVLTNDTQAVDRGGGILFGGKWTNAGNSFAYFGGVKAGKENSTSAEYGGYLAFYSRTNGATGLAERARIDSSGNFGIGTTSPQARAHVSATANFNAVLKISDATSNQTGALVLGDNNDARQFVGVWRASPNSVTVAGSALNLGSPDSIVFTVQAGQQLGSQTERARIDSAGNFGIKQSSPSSWEPGMRDLVIGALDGSSYGITLVSTTQTTLAFSNGTTGTQKYAGFVQYSPGTSRLDFGAGGAARVGVITTGLDVSTAGYGIKLQGTGGTNNTDPNVLDFYADGGTANSGGVTWTPTLKFGGNTTGITYATQVGRYTRIGNMVFASAYIILSSKGTAVGNATIDGLPAASTLANLYSSASISYLVNVTFASQPVGYIGPGATWMNLTQNVSGGASSSLTNAEFSNTSAIIFSIAYSVN